MSVVVLNAKWHLTVAMYQVREIPHREWHRTVAMSRAEER
jgi:hypothetical protein